MITVINVAGMPAKELAAAIERGEVVYIGRNMPRRRLAGNGWGNPFVIGEDGNREEVIEQFRTWLMVHPELLARLPELSGKKLGCWCWPKPCHGDVLAALAEGVQRG